MLLASPRRLAIDPVALVAAVVVVVSGGCGDKGHHEKGSQVSPDAPSRGARETPVLTTAPTKQADHHAQAESASLDRPPSVPVPQIEHGKVVKRGPHGRYVALLLRWSDVSASGYRVQMSRDASFASIEVDADVDSAVFFKNKIKAGLLRFRVQARRGSALSPFSETFTLDAAKRRRYAATTPRAETRQKKRHTRVRGQQRGRKRHLVDQKDTSFGPQIQKQETSASKGATTTAPASLVTLESPVSGAHFAEPTVNLQGVAPSRARVEVGGLQVGRVMESGSFSLPVTLEEGTNELVVTIRHAGATETFHRSVVYIPLHKVAELEQQFDQQRAQLASLADALEELKEALYSIEAAVGSLDEVAKREARQVIEEIQRDLEEGNRAREEVQGSIVAVIKHLESLRDETTRRTSSGP